jgi:phosphoesterase RecJ-like protein
MTVYQEILNEIKAADRIVITSHKSPDGDSIGCSMGLYQFICKLGKTVHVVHPDKAPNFLHWVQDMNQIVIFEEEKVVAADLLQKADLVFSLDYNTPNRVGSEMEIFLRTSNAKKIVIDHHPHPEAEFYNIVFSDTYTGSTSELIFRLIEQSGHLDKMDSVIGTPLYLGIMTDTGSFRFPSVSPETHEVLAKLMRSGVEHYMVHEQVFDTNTVDRLKLRGYATSEKLEIVEDFPVAIISLTSDELKRFNYQKGDTEGLVNVALSIQDIQMAALFSEKDGVIKISLRSKGAQEVSQLANDLFTGGGHKYASGAVYTGKLVDAIDLFKNNLSKYWKS